MAAYVLLERATSSPERWRPARIRATQISYTDIFASLCQTTSIHERGIEGGLRDIMPQVVRWWAERGYRVHTFKCSRDGEWASFHVALQRAAGEA